eukprot:11796853-Prorocentrum_lima.AAC.1
MGLCLFHPKPLSSGPVAQVVAEQRGPPRQKEPDTHPAVLTRSSAAPLWRPPALPHPGCGRHQQ